MFSNGRPVGSVEGAEPEPRTVQACTKPYDPNDCFGYVFLPNEDLTSQVKSCVKMTFRAELPAQTLFTLGMKEYSLGISDVENICKWVAILVMTWNFQETPFLAPSAASKEFMNRVWLLVSDIMPRMA